MTLKKNNKKSNKNPTSKYKLKNTSHDKENNPDMWA
jgi:hypothetical protein